ncbi:helix-turn-helix domain-containing protein [Aneurinibacillus aneurinilyticus]|uniref:helix-turn-helix domain-containing protein n=1 Tax=Aneurinibacillus aneurinilyticus TaxID=1391 RepID=UPI003673293B
MELGNKIKALRLQKKLTQADLSKLAQVAQSVISDIENNKRKQGISVIYVQRLAKAIGVTVAELLDEEEQTA